ncbi:MAG TPA: hypothetical protein VEB22_07100 [Phycisphaerales bacterium]|nr:hypothetical protein [Phycisphaerales bacterium]
MTPETAAHHDAGAVASRSAAAQPGESPGVEPWPPQVLYARKCKLPSEVKASTGYTIHGLVVVLALLVGAALWAFSLRYVSIPGGRAGIPIALAALLLLWILFTTVRSWRARRSVGPMEKKLDFDLVRFAVVGTPAQVRPLVAAGELRDEPFEPVVIFTPRIFPLPGAGTAVLVVTTIAFNALLVLLKKTTTLPVMGFGWLTIMAGIAVGVAVQILIWPTYTRVAPGRLDVMRFRLGSGRPEVTTINLRRACVLAHLSQSSLFVKPPAPGARWQLLSLRGVWNGAELTHAVLRGAASTAPTPPLPSDQLVG